MSTDAPITRGPPSSPLYPPADSQEIAALVALSLGEADQQQQRIALSWILGKACAVNFPAWVPGDVGEMAVWNAGRHFAAQAICNAAGIKIAALPQTIRTKPRG